MDQERVAISCCGFRLNWFRLKEAFRKWRLEREETGRKKEEGIARV